MHISAISDGIKITVNVNVCRTNQTKTTHHTQQAGNKELIGDIANANELLSGCSGAHREEARNHGSGIKISLLLNSPSEFLCFFF